MLLSFLSRCFLLYTHNIMKVSHCGRLMGWNKLMMWGGFVTAASVVIWLHLLSFTCYAEGPLALVMGLSSPRRVWERTLLTPWLFLVRFPARAASWTCFIFSWTSALACCSRSVWPWMLWERRKGEISIEGKGGASQGCRGRWRQRAEVEGGRLKERKTI